MLIYVPCFPHLYSKFDSAVGHFRRYTRRELIGKVESAGMDVVEIRYLDPVGYIAALTYRSFVNNGALKGSHVSIFDRLLYPGSRFLARFTGNIFGKNLLIYARRPSN